MADAMNAGNTGNQGAAPTGDLAGTQNGGTPAQLYAASQTSAPGSSTGPGSADPTLSAAPVSQTQDAAAINGQISGNTSGVVFPQAPGAPTNGISANTGIPNPIPSAADILSQGTGQTPAEKTNTTLLQKVAALIGGKQGQTDLTNSAESAAGVPALQKTVNDLNTQLEGLNNQATDLQNQAGTYGAINSQAGLDIAGTGTTKGNIGDYTSGPMLQNNIKQAMIASQALTLKSAIYGAQGNLTLAKDAADKAATAQYEDQQNQIDYQNALIAANLPQMTKEEKAQADLVTANLQDRQTAITNAQDDKKTIIAMATAAMQANPSDPAVQYAAQQALAESNKQQPDLQKVIGLIGQYQTLDTQLKVAQIAQARASAAKDLAAAATTPNDPGAVPTDPNSQSILSQTGLSVAAFNFLTQGTSALSRLSATDRKNIMSEAQNYLNKNGVDYSTFQSQYKAYNTVVQNNIQRANQTKVMAGEVTGSADALISAINGSKVQTDPFNSLATGGMKSLKAGNVLDLMIGNQVNSKFAQTYGTQIRLMANDLAGYLAAARGATSPELQDQRDAANIISNGMNTGSTQAFKEAIQANEEKVAGVVDSAVNSGQQQVWDLFGVGSKYQSSNPTATEPTNNAKGAKWVRADGTYVSDGTKWVKQ